MRKIFETIKEKVTRRRKISHERLHNIATVVYIKWGEMAGTYS
jgi:hypothetical protein